MALKDSDIIGWGKYARTPLKDVPDIYLKWVQDNSQRNAGNRQLLIYINKRLGYD